MMKKLISAAAAVIMTFSISAAFASDEDSSVKATIVSAAVKNTQKNAVTDAPNLFDGDADPQSEKYGATGDDDTSWSNDEKYAREFVIDIGEERDITELKLYPTVYNITAGSKFPKQFKIQVSSNGETYTDVFTQSTDYYEDPYTKAIWNDASQTKDTVLGPKTVQSFDVNAKGRYVKLYVTKSGVYSSYKVEEIKKGFISTGFSEIEVYAAPKINLTKAQITSAEIGGETVAQVDGAAMIDGITDANGIAVNDSSNASSASDRTGKAFWAILDLGEAKEIGEIDLYPFTRPIGSAFPRQFRIEISNDEGENKTWSTVYETDGDYYEDTEWADWQTNPPKAPTGPSSAQKFVVNGTARYIRIYSTKSGIYTWNGGGNKGFANFGFNEIEVFTGTKYEIVNTYSDGENTVTSLEGLSSVTVSSKLINNMGAVREAVVIHALYYDGVMKSARFQSVSMEAEATAEPQTFDLTETDKSKYELKTFLWDGFTNIKPYCTNAVIPGAE